MGQDWSSGVSPRTRNACPVGSPSRRASCRGVGVKTQEHLTTAMAMYREMRMDFWLEKAEAAMGPPRRNSP